MKLRGRRSDRQNRQTHHECGCNTEISSLPIVNEMLNADAVDALALQIEIESWSPEELQQAFGTGIDANEFVDREWRRSWARIGESLRCVMMNHLNDVPEPDRTRLQQSLEQ